MKLLVVDDYPLEGKTIEFLLKRDRPEIQYCGQALNSETGKEMLLQMQPDIAIVDVRMPGIDGLSLLKEIKHQIPDVNVIILSASGDFSFVQSAIRLGACDYLLKPLDPEELYQAIDRITKAAGTPKPSIPEPIEEKASQVNMLEIPETLIQTIKAGKTAECEAQFQEIWESHIQCDECPLQEIKFRSRYFLSQVFEQLTEAEETQESKALQDRKEYLYRHFITQLPAILDIQTIKASLLEYVQSMANVYAHHFISAGDEQIERAKAIIEKNIGNKLSLTMVAQEVYISSFYLSSLFKKRTGMNFIDYLIERRIEKAKQLLSTTNETVEVISAQVGYDECNYFRRLFKKKVGLTPREYRRQNLRQQDDKQL